MSLGRMGERSLRGLRDETEELRFVTFAIALRVCDSYNLLIRVDTDKELIGWMEQIKRFWI